MFDDRLMNLFYFVHQKKDFLFGCLHFDEFVLLKQRDAFQFNGAVDSSSCSLISYFLFFLLSFYCISICVELTENRFCVTCL